MTYAREMAQRLRDSYRTVMEAHMARARAYDRRTNKLNPDHLPVQKYDIDALVFLRLGSETVDPRISKYSALVQGPYRVVARFNGGINYEIQLVADPNPANNRVVHISRLIPYTADVQQYLEWINSTTAARTDYKSGEDKKTWYEPLPLTDTEKANLAVLQQAQAEWDKKPKSKTKVLALSIPNIPVAREMTPLWAKYHDSVTTRVQTTQPLPTPEEVVQMTHEQLSFMPAGPTTRQTLAQSRDPKYTRSSMAE